MSQKKSKSKVKRLIVTADDFGLDVEINRGIIKAHVDGVVTSASLLMNAPATKAACELSRSYPDLEIGIHLSIVEGIALGGVRNTMTDELSYFGPELCLHRHWKDFLKRYIRSAINLTELERELELQIQSFLNYFPAIPFANSTQHLHILPGVRDVVLKLAKKYKIGALRIPHSSRNTTPVNTRWIYNRILMTLGRGTLKRAVRLPLNTTDHFGGFDVCGRLDEKKILRILSRWKTGTLELMTHPGFESPYLRQNLPWGYSAFAWEGELGALTSPRVKDRIADLGIDLVRFGDLVA